MIFLQDFTFSSHTVTMVADRSISCLGSLLNMFKNVSAYFWNFLRFRTNNFAYRWYKKHKNCS